MVFILYTRMQEKQDNLAYNKYLNILPATIQNRIKRFYHWQDAYRSLLGNLLLIEGLKAIDLKDQSLESLSYTQYKKPYFNNAHFNISHSGLFVICAISKATAVGVDVEEVIDIPVNEFTEEFSAEEIAAIQDDKSLKYFYDLWTQKESFLKAIGKGLSVPLNQVSVKNNCIAWQGKNWFLHKIELDENYSSHLCSDVENPGIKIQEFMF